MIIKFVYLKIKIVIAKEVIAKDGYNYSGC